MNIALFGHMASGKSSIAQALIDIGYVRLAFAQPLKDISELAYGPIDKSGKYTVVGLDGAEETISGREVLQRVGQSIKTHDRDFWLRCFFRTATTFGRNPLVVDDGRFLFECDALREKGWLIVGVAVPVEVRRERYLAAYGRYPTPEEESHQSEVEIPDIIAGADLLLDGTDSPLYNASIITERTLDWQSTPTSPTTPAQDASGSLLHPYPTNATLQSARIVTVRENIGSHGSTAYGQAGRPVNDVTEQEG